jgi:hypothetical protein
MQNELNTFIEAIKADYVGFNEITDIRKEMIETFNSSIEIIEGKKFIKIAAGGAAHSFIVKEDDGKFKRGDILKAATWAAPAKNFARGNILTGGYKIRWTGA